MYFNLQPKKAQSNISKQIFLIVLKEPLVLNLKYLFVSIFSIKEHYQDQSNFYFTNFSKMSYLHFR